MPQAWTEVEQNPDFQKMAPPEQMAAKQQYFNEVVSQKPEFQQLPQDEQGAAQKQFMGTPITTGNPTVDMAGANKDLATAQANQKNILPQAAAGMGKDLTSMGLNFANQFLMNAPRSIANTIGKPIDFDAETDAGNIAAHAAGVAGALMSPLNKLALMKSTTLGARIGAGALAGAAYSPNDNVFDVKGRAIQAGMGAAANPMIAPIADKVAEMFAPAAEKISSTIQDLYSKAVKPTIVKGNAGMLADANANVESGVKSIINNKNNLTFESGNQGLPKTLGETAEAIEQTKNDIFNKYNAMQQQATGKGVTINGQGLAQSLLPILDDKATSVVSPKTQDYAVELFQRLQDAGDMTPEDLQNVIKGFNGRLKAFYKNPSPDQYGNTAVDALIANNARKALDDAITGTAGAGYQDLKNQYGALSSMEKDVSRASQRTSNYQAKGLLDFTDIFTGEQIVKGLMSGNPAELTSGLAARLIKEHEKYMNSPDANISRMFSKVDGYMSGQNIWKNAFTKNIASAIKPKYQSVLNALQSGKQNISQGAQPIVGNMGNMDAAGAGQPFAQPAVTNAPADTTRAVGGPESNMESEGAPPVEYSGPNPKGERTSITRLRQVYKKNGD